MDWEVFYYQTQSGDSPVEDFLDDLSIKARAKCLSYMDALEEHGHGPPSSYIKKVEGDLWELRPEFGGVEHRLFYFTFVQRPIIVVHAIKKKRQKLRRQDIDTALRRVEDVRRREEERQEKPDDPEDAPAVRARADREES